MPLEQCKWENPPARVQEQSQLQRKEGENSMFCNGFEAGLSPAMVCVGILVLGTKLNQYTLSDLNSLLANSLSYGCAKQIGCTDDARRALVALGFPLFWKGGELSYVQSM